MCGRTQQHNESVWTRAVRRPWTVVCVVAAVVVGPAAATASALARAIAPAPPLHAESALETR